MIEFKDGFLSVYFNGQDLRGLALMNGATFNRLVFIVLLVLFCLSAGAGRGLARQQSTVITTPYSDKGVYRALVIGNDRYRDPQGVWKPLNTAVADAKAVGALLKTHYGFSDVRYLLNATRRDILVALNQLHQRVKHSDSVLLYYAGHGYRNKSTKEAYWIPVDAVGLDDSFFLSNARIKEKLAVIADRANHTLLLSDSCFSGSLTRGVHPPPAASQLNEPYFRKVAQRKSVQILSAGGDEFVGDSFRNSGHSPFTYFLVKELLNNNQRFYTAASLSGNVSRVVANNAYQTPQSGVLHGAGDEGGEFIFVRSSLSTAGVRPQATGMTGAGTKIKIDPMAVELSYWNSVKEINKKEYYQAYLHKFPNGVFADIAKFKLKSSRGNNIRQSDIMNELVGRYKLTMEAGDFNRVRQISQLSPGREGFMKQLFSYYRTFTINVSDFRIINRKQKAVAQVEITNLVNKQGNRVQPGRWSRYPIEIRKDSRGSWKIHW